MANEFKCTRTRTTRTTHHLSVANTNKYLDIVADQRGNAFTKFGVNGRGRR